MKTVLRKMAGIFTKELGRPRPNNLRTWASALLIGLACFASAQDTEERVVVVPLGKPVKEAPLFYSAAATVKGMVNLTEINSDQHIDFKILQGKPETLTLALSGAGDVVSLTGAGVKDWAVRVGADGARFLDVRPLIADGKNPETLQIDLKTHLMLNKGMGTLLLPAPGPATGFTLALSIAPDPGADLHVLKADGLSPVTSKTGREFLGNGVANIEISVSPSGSASRGLELLNTSVLGRLAADGGSIVFKLSGVARAQGDGSVTELLGGTAALSSGVSGAGWHVVLRDSDPNHRGYDLVAERAGEFPVEVEFVVPVTRKGDWRVLDFTLPAGTVVPVRIAGLGEGVTFDRALAVVPERDGTDWRGFLPANGKAAMRWKTAGAVADGALFFSSTETTDVRIGSGLMRQLTVVDLRVLQGKLTNLSLSLTGPGEILAVTGEAVIGWSVVENAGKRHIDIKLSRPIEGNGRFVVEAQSALGGFPVKSESLRIVPDGSLRHSGWLRVANDGAVRIEVADAKGLIQLAPGQFPGGVDGSLRQVFVYRFPAADYTYTIQADQVLPEVGVTEVTVYELGETDRRISADLELDIREAPLREWEMEIPSDHAVASVTGAEVADYTVGTDIKDGKRRLKIIFRGPVADRQLVSVRLEKNEAAKAGPWELAPLGFPGTKSRRGYIGAVAAAGFRLVAGKSAGMVEVPLTFFPKKTEGLQQAFRLREGDWQLALSVEALGQSIQADVFHLYSLKAGSAYGSVLINYFVVGAPATEWKISVPEGIGNIDVTGQNVGRDWRREGNVVIVPLSRPVLGTGTVLLTFEQPMNARGGDLTPGEVHPLDVQAERGYVQVVSPLQVKFAKPVIEGPLLEIDPTELPAEFRLLSSAPTLKAWQYTARDYKVGAETRNFKIAMKIEWFEQGDTVEQVVDFLKLTSKVSRDGQWVTDARLFVKSKGRSALRAGLPAGALLWEAKVNGETVNAREDGKEILIPLPSLADPNKAVEVTLRYGARSASARRPHLAAPILAAPVVIGEWTITGDEGRQLVPRGGSAELVKPGLAETGWEWTARHGGAVGLLFLLGLLAFAAGCGRVGGWKYVISMLLGLAFVGGALAIGLAAASSGRGNAAALEYAAPVVAAGSEVFVDVGNVASWQARISIFSLLVFIAGVIVIARGWLKKDGLWKVGGVALIATALLSVRGGTPLFFMMSALLALSWWIPRLWQGLKNARPAPVAEAVAVIALLTVFSMNNANAAAIPGVKAAESMIQDWQIRDGRLRGTLDITLRGEPGDRFLLLRAPAVLSGFEGAGLRVVKAPLDGGEAYFMVAENAGRLTGKATFEMPAGDFPKGFELPGGPAALRQVTLHWDQAGWEFFSPGAARVTPLSGAANESGAVMVLGPADPVIIQARPKQRDVGAEETKYFAEVSNLFLPGPGVVNGRHRVSIRPAQGRVGSLLLKVPEGFTVSDVSEGPAGSWRFDPEKGELRVPIEPAQDQAFELTIETQRGAGVLPVDLNLEPLRVIGAAGEIGYLALAFGDEAQPETVEVEGLSRVNAEDFDRGLLPKDANGNALVLLQHSFRYGPAAAVAHVKVSAVAPELRAESWQLVSLGDDRLVVATDLVVSITRSGVFRLVVDVPDGLDIESATGEGLSHWTETKTPTGRLVTLHLTERTMGTRVFSLTMTGRPPGSQEKWQVPRLTLKDASRETGMVTVVPERGLQVRAVDRKNVSQVDPKSLAEAQHDSARAAVRPGALAYRILQSDWDLRLAISRLEPWVTAQVFHEATLREGQMLSRVVINYKIENSALKALRVRIPGLDATAASTVRASGPAVADLVPVEGDASLREIRFQRGVAGETSVVLEYQRASKEGANEVIEPVVLDRVRQLSYFVAVRAGGRLELEPGTIPRGWQRTDWAVVQSSLGPAAGNVAPLMAFRVADPEGPLPIILKRHELADLQKLRVSEGTLTTLMSPAGDALTAVDLKMQVVGKDTLRLKLPAGAALFNVLVNDEGVTLVREGGEWLFYVFPSPEVGRPTTVRFVYSAGTSKGKRLEGPILNVPMENLTWRVLVPEGWHMTDHDGDFDLKEQSARGAFKLEDYQSFVQNKKETDSKSAVALLDQANVWLREGDQEKASLALGNAVRSNQLDAASGEDARVQLRQLKTQQAVLGLNTRRQKLVLDNITNVPQGNKQQFDRAAEANPVLRGDYNYDPKQYEQFLEGNTADENAALKDIANRIVTQQLAAEPAPAAIDVTLPERGTVLVFGRSVQVDGERPMSISIELKRDGQRIAWAGIALCLLLGAMGGARRMSRA